MTNLLKNSTTLVIEKSEIPVSHVADVIYSKRILGKLGNEFTQKKPKLKTVHRRTKRKTDPWVVSGGLLAKDHS